MKTHLNCPCGEAITGTDEDDLVEKAQKHLSEQHPGRESTGMPSSSWPTDPHIGHGTTVEPMVGMNWHCFSVVVTWPKIVDKTLPDPVSTMAESVVGPCGLISGRGLSVALPDLPVLRLTQVTFSGNLCSAAGAGVPTAVNT